jgi:acyl-CoA thioesterase-2
MTSDAYDWRSRAARRAGPELERLEPLLFRTHPQAEVQVASLRNGGVLGHALLSAIVTVDDSRLADSVSTHFVKARNPAKSVYYRVAVAHDGALASVRTVEAFQDGHPILLSTSSFRPSAGGLNDAQSSRRLARPHDSVPTADFAAELPVTMAGLEEISRPLGIDIRLPEPDEVRTADDSAPGLRIWVRLGPQVQESRLVTPASLVAISDVSRLAAKVGRPRAKRGTQLIDPVPLSRSVYFHVSQVPEEWILYEFKTDWIGGARSLVRARMFSSNGWLLASSVEEWLSQP